MEAQKKLRLALIGALVVILVLVGALVWSLTSDSGEVKAGPVSPSAVATATGGGRVDLSEPRPGNTVPATSQASINPTGKVDTWGSVCGLAGVELKPTVQVNLPAMRTKAFVDSTYYYYNNLVGPDRRIDGDVPTCYAHSSEGAILAAANLQVMLGAGKKKVELIKTLTYENDAQQAALKKIQERGDSATAVSIKIVGYSIEVIDENNATVNLAFTRSDEPGDLYKNTFKMTWSKGDWKAVIPADGKSEVEEISSITNAGMVSWIL